MSAVRIAVDGPAGAGKSTAASLLAARLGYRYVDTGAMYRAVTLAALRAGCPLHDEGKLLALLEGLRIELGDTPGDGRARSTVLLNGEDVTEAIRSPEVSEAVSQVAAHPGVRQALVSLQRRLAEGGSVVMDGRDIGTVVLPDAEVKFFLTATVEARARRRWLELAAAGHHVELPQMVRAVRARDEADSRRRAAPLRRAPDAVTLDTTGLDPAEVVERMLRVVRQRLGEHGLQGAGARQEERIRLCDPPFTKR